MSSRFHNKYHRHNHHTVALDDPRYPDASHDPIASPDSPFLGPFVMFGTLSAMGMVPTNQTTNYGVSGDIIAGIFVAPQLSATALEAQGSVSVLGTLSAANIIYTGPLLTSYNTPVTATGEFLLINVNNVKRAVRLWQYE
jgi:hypothetical protein